MRKDDVEFHSDGYGREAKPAVNVKVQFPFDWESLWREAALDAGATQAEAERFVEWAEANSETKLEWTFEAACRDGWESLQSHAEEIFGRGVKVYSQGRSGGWAVVEGLRDFEDWDAIYLAKWARFSKWAKAQAADVPHEMAMLSYLNSWPEPHKDLWSERGC